MSQLKPFNKNKPSFASVKETQWLLSVLKNQNYWLSIIQWTGGVAITYILAKLFWVIMMAFLAEDVSTQKSTLSQSAMASNGSEARVNINALVQRELFGSTDVPVTAPVQEVVERETRLNLKLRGIYAADIAEHSNSIIEDGKGKQAVYFINDKLSVSGRVYLRRVYPDRVILETNGVNEVLRLKDVVPKNIQRSKPKLRDLSKRTNELDMRKNRDVTQSLNKYRKKLQDDPLSLVGLVNYQPKMVNGEMMGIQISPGKDKRLFTQLGLRRKDVITAINGVSLNSTQNAMQLLGEIQEMQELQVEINRDNKNISLLLNLSDKVGI